MLSINEILLILRDASSRLPQLKFTWGLLGIAAVASVIVRLLGENKASIIIIGLTIIGVVIVFVASIAFGTAALALLPTQVLIWAITIFFITFLGFTITAFAISWPCNWTRFLELEATECIPPTPDLAFMDFKRKVDFSGLKIDQNGQKKDLVTFEDEIYFSRLPDNGFYVREFQMPPGSSLKAFDLVSGTEVTPPYKQGGQQVYGQAVFKIDRNTNKAKLRWVYENAHGGDREGVGFSSSDIRVRNVLVNYKLPDGKQFCGNREFKPSTLENKCRRFRDGFECENLMISSEFRELWSWNIWNPCVN